MGLLGDFKEVTENWKERSLGFKVISIFALFLTISSITSLADIIIEWKGFIRDGLSFYHDNFRDPIRELLEVVNLSYSPEQADSLTVFTLAYLTAIRTVILEYKEKVIGKRTMIFYLVSFILLVLLTNIVVGSVVNSFLYIIIPGVLAFGIIIFLAIDSKPHRKALLIPVIAIIITLLLAAINKGLTS